VRRGEEEEEAGNKGKARAENRVMRLSRYS